jgi:Tfp pilus assembly protein PilV
MNGQIDDERGSILLEALVSGILLVIAAVGVFSAFEAGTRASAEERHRAQAEGLAQADLARLRTMRISALANLHQTKVVTIEKTAYTVESEAAFQTDSTGTASCAKASAKADYIMVKSTITWPSLGSREPVEEQSLVAPPNGSISAHSGSLAVQIENAENGGVQGVELNGTGAGVFAGVTGANGCAIFGDLPAGNYTLNVSGPSLVDKNGEAPKPQSTSVVEESTNTLALQYDFGGSVTAKFQTRVDGELVPSSADSVVAFNSGMQKAKAFGTLGTRSAEVTATPLFPFTSAYSVYAGTCEQNDPSLTGKESLPESAIAEPVVSAKGTTTVTIELPALHLTSWSGTQAEPGTPVSGAEVKVADVKCTPEKPAVRTFTTNAEGELPDPGLPFSTYDVCVSDGTKHVSVAELDVPAKVEEMTVGTTLSVFLGASGAEIGKCP